MDPDIDMQEVIHFILELDKLKGVTRKIRPLGLDRYENSAEHSWQLALFAMALSPYAETEIDLDRVIRMLLVHDIGEIDAGDRLAFAEGGWEETKAAELASVERIFAILPPPQGAALLALWLEFERADTAEARFANAVDRAMPVLLNLANHGQSWRENQISYERVVKRIESQIKEGCPALWEYIAARLEQERQQGWFAISAN